MTDIAPRPPRRAPEIVLTVLGAVLALLALVIPIVPLGVGSGGVEVPVILLSFTSPIERPVEAVLPIALLLLIVGLVLPTVVLLRAVVARRAGRVARALTVVAGVGVVLWGIFFAASALAPPAPVAIFASLAMALAGATALIAQSAVLAPLIPRRPHPDAIAEES